MIPITRVVVDDEARRLVQAVLESGHLVQGPMVEELEDLFRELTGTRHAIAVSSGTAALVVALQALGLEPGDEVLTSPFTFVATLNAILQAGASATFADVDDRHLVLDPEVAARAATDATKVIMPVHLYGCPAPMEDVSDQAAARGWQVVEDAAQAHGARVGERPAGSFGIGCFSLYATKNVQTGEGGMITTDDDEIAERARLLRNHGMRGRYDYAMPGHNFRLSDLHAAIGIPQMRRIDATIKQRAANAAALSAGLGALAGLRVPLPAEGRTHVFHQYTVRVLDDAPVTRDELARRLTAAGVGTGVYYPRLVWDYDCFRHHPRVQQSDTPVAATAARQVLSLPVHEHLTPAEIDRIVESVSEAMDA